MKDLLNKFKYEVASTGCHNCTSHKPRKNGYILINKKTFGESYLHLLVWKTFNEQEIPENHDIVHVCENFICMNPYHLSLVPKFIEEIK
jgi:hypothetical protein